MIERSTLDKLEFPKVLNHIAGYTVTEKGKEKILSLLPSTNPDIIKSEGNIVVQAKEILIKNIAPPLEYISDLTDVLAQSRIEGASLSAKKILDVLKLAKISRTLYQYLKLNSEIAPLLTKSIEHLFVEKVFEHHIEKIIDDNGEVKDRASTKLSDLRKEIRDKQSDLIKSINKIMKSLEDDGMVREEYLTLRDGRMVIPIKSEHKRHLRGFIHSESASGQTVYIEPEQTLDLNNEIISLGFAEKREIERLLKELTQLIGKESVKLQEALEAISYIDSVFARAKYSIETLGCFPQLKANQHFTIGDARHPVLLKKLGRQNTVPLNFKLLDENVIIITGPNAGGKTVVLKTVGLLSLLLQSGIHIPVDPDSNFHCFENVLIDIGDEQSIEDDLSTFSSHLTNIKNILNSADQNSLILLDEIGTGTDPAEGAALATAVLIQLRDKGALVFASTHHGSLKLVAHNETGFINAAMEFDHEKLTPAYKFKLGIPGSSYAFEIARRIGIDEKLLDLASGNIDSGKHKIERFLIEIESKSNKLEAKLKEAEIENTRLNGLSSLYKSNIEKLEKEKKEILKKAKSDAEDFLSDVNKKVEAVIRELRESKAEHSVIKKSKEIIEEVKKETEIIYTPEITKDLETADIEIGSFVNIKDTTTAGKIIQIDREKGRAVIQAGTIKMKVKIDELTSAKIKKEEPAKHYHDYKIPASNYRIDIRGRKPEEADFEVIKFLDDSYMSGQERVEILHGKGTGVLKRTVKEILDSHEKVKNYYFAPIEFGGEGITIVELK